MKFSFCSLKFLRRKMLKKFVKMWWLINSAYVIYRWSLRFRRSNRKFNQHLPIRWADTTYGVGEKHINAASKLHIIVPTSGENYCNQKESRINQKDVCHNRDQGAVTKGIAEKRMCETEIIFRKMGDNKAKSRTLIPQKHELAIYLIFMEVYHCPWE